MTQKEKMLYAVLRNERLMSSYGYSKEDIEGLDFHEALASDKPIIVAVAKLIDELKGSMDASVQKQTYQKLFQYLNTNLFV